jgi:hypothetical protein
MTVPSRICLSNSARRRLLVGAGAWLMGCAIAGKSHGKEQPVGTKNMTIWQLLSALEPLMPFSAEKLETATGSKFDVAQRDDHFINYVAGGQSLEGAVAIDKMNLMLRPPARFDEKSAFAMELSGACITLEDVRGHYADLHQSASARGRSPQEVTVWRCDRAWGVLSFAFKEANPDCLFRVSFRKQKS